MDNFMAKLFIFGRLRGGDGGGGRDALGLDGRSVSLQFASLARGVAAGRSFVEKGFHIIFRRAEIVLLKFVFQLAQGFDRIFSVLFGNEFLVRFPNFLLLSIISELLLQPFPFGCFGTRGFRSSAGAFDRVPRYSLSSIMSVPTSSHRLGVRNDFRLPRRRGTTCTEVPPAFDYDLCCGIGWTVVVVAPRVSAPASGWCCGSKIRSAARAARWPLGE